MSHLYSLGSILDTDVSPGERPPPDTSRTAFRFEPRLREQAVRSQWALTQTVLAGVLSGIILVLQSWLLSQVINAVFLEGSGLDEVRRNLWMLVVLSLVQAALHYWRERSAQTTSNQIQLDLRSKLIQHLLRLGPDYTARERTGELTNVLQEDLDALDVYFRNYIPQLALAALIPITIWVFVIWMDPTSGWILLLTAPLIPIFMVLIGDAVGRRVRQQWTALGRLSAFFLDAMQGILTLKSFGRSKEQVALIRRVSVEYGQATMGVLRVAFLSAFVLEFIATLSTALVAVGIGVRLLNGGIEFAPALFILFVTPEFYLPLRVLGSHFHVGVAGVIAAERIIDVLDTPAAIPAPTEIKEFSPDRAKAEISFRAVSFRYLDRVENTLSGFSLRISSGQVTALIGPTGCGKSTVANLLLGFIQPDQGQIQIDGEALSPANIQSWRSMVSWVPQRPTLFNGSIADNIRLARPTADMDAVIAVARAANADEFIRNLPDAYDTQLDIHAGRLSGGEVQRIALARAFMKDAPVLVMDEPTARLDSRTEADLLEAMQRLLQGRTVLIIAHRFPIIQQADLVVVMGGGVILEQGNPDQLAEAGGEYASLLQAYKGAT